MIYLKLLKNYFFIGYIVFVKRKIELIRFYKKLERDIGIKKSDISIETIKRIDFYSFQSFAILGIVSALRGKKANKNETHRAVFLGALTPLIDDLTDKKNLISAEITKIISQKLNPKDEIEIQLAKYLYQDLSKFDNSYFKKYIQQTYQAQEKSMIQSNIQQVDNQQLLKITKDKGASATLLYRSFMENPFLENEEKAFETLGFIFQLMNDMFDVYKDYHNKNQTTFTNNADIHENKKHFYQLVENFILEIQSTNYKKADLQDFTIIVSTIIGRGMVCINQLTNLQDNNYGKFEIKQFSRKQLVCDMEKFSNIILSLKYSYKIMSGKMT